MKSNRLVAYEILEETLLKNNYTGLLLKKINLSVQDQSFVTRLVYSTLQNYDLMVYQFQSYLEKNIPKTIEIILAMGCTQFYKMDGIENYAIVNEMVEVCKKVKPAFSGLVNAVLKKTINQPLRLSQKGDSAVDLAINTSHPVWMSKLFIAQYGHKEAQSILEHDMESLPNYVRYNPLKISEEKFLANYQVKKVDKILVADEGFFQSDALRNGYALIQDRASQEVVNFLELKGDENILDACSAPGTKTSQLALMVPHGQVVAVELHPHRLELVNQLMQRLGISNVETVCSDILTFHPDQKFDVILCDVPCSGMGVMGRKPDIKFRLEPNDLDSLQVLQAQILDHCGTYLKVGGYLLYSTCTLNKKENEMQIKQFLIRNPQFEMIKQETILGYERHSDSFYHALLIKRSENMIK